VGVRDDVIFRAINHAVACIIALRGRRGPAASVARALMQRIAPVGSEPQMRREVQ
jgi:hypothetical protein